jgi:sigma-B regulation protein RsbU (phosphoserine phosphatase)
VSRRDGDVVVDRVGDAGLPIGMLPVALFANAEIDVPLDSNLFLFSDGAYEITQPDGNMWTLDAFAETLRASDPASGLANLDEVEAMIRRIRGQADFEDDVSILGVRFGR